MEPVVWSTLGTTFSRLYAHLSDPDSLSFSSVLSSSFFKGPVFVRTYVRTYVYWVSLRMRGFHWDRNFFSGEKSQKEKVPAYDIQSWKYQNCCSEMCFSSSVCGLVGRSFVRPWSVGLVFLSLIFPANLSSFVSTFSFVRCTAGCLFFSKWWPFLSRLFVEERWEKMICWTAPWRLSAGTIFTPYTI